MSQPPPLRTLLVGLLIVALGLLLWLRTDVPPPSQPLFATSANRRSEARSHEIIELAELGKSAETLTLLRNDGTIGNLRTLTRDDVRARSVEYLGLDVVKGSSSQLASFIVALRRQGGHGVPESAWRPLLLVGKALSLRADALLVSEGPEAAWRQLLQGLTYAEVLYASAGSISQVAIARTVQSYFALTICDAIAAAEWSPRMLAAISQLEVSFHLGPPLLRSIEHEYTSAVASAEAESRATPVFIRDVVYQPNRTESLWSTTLGRAVVLLRSERFADGYRLATAPPPVREEVPIWRNWLGYQFSVPSIQACVASIVLVANAELQMQLVRIAANLGSHRAEYGAFPQSLQELAKRYPETNIYDPWMEGVVPLRYDARAGVVYSVGTNRVDDHAQFRKSFESSSTSDDYGVRLMP